MIGGKFALTHRTLSRCVAGKVALPAGGNVVMILAKDQAKRDAAWEVVKFWTGPKGAAIMAEDHRLHAAQQPGQRTSI